jgi:hypothetical protein
MSVKHITARRPSGLTRGFTIVELRKSGEREDTTGTEESGPAQ